MAFSTKNTYDVNIYKYLQFCETRNIKMATIKVAKVAKHAGFIVLA